MITSFKQQINKLYYIEYISAISYQLIKTVEASFSFKKWYFLKTRPFHQISKTQQNIKKSIL